MDCVLVGLLLLLCTYHCEAVVQGIPDSGNQYSSVCALLQKEGTSYRVTCSAVLINPSTLLTAAHCAGQFTYVSCDWSVTDSPTLYNQSAVENHPLNQETAEGLKQDLAVIKLKTGVMGQPAAPLPPLQVLDDIRDAGGFAADDALTVVGYGRTQQILDPDSTAVPNNNRVRHSTPADFNRLTINRLEASLSLQRGAGGSVCSGDSGGAVFYAKTGLLAGITIEADNICNKFAKANRLDTSVVRRWLAASIDLP